MGVKTIYKKEKRDIIMTKAYRFSYNGKEMTVICHQGETIAECYESLKERFRGIKISKNEVNGKKSPHSEGKC